MKVVQLLVFLSSVGYVFLIKVGDKIISGCSSEDSIMVEDLNCKSLDVTLSHDSPQDRYYSHNYNSQLSTLFFDEQSDSSVRIIKVLFLHDWTPEDIGAVVDSFLTPRPWWTTRMDDYHPKIGHASFSVKLIYIPRIDTGMKMIAKYQYPVDCHSVQSYCRFVGELTEYGNERGNVDGAFHNTYGGLHIEIARTAHFVNSDYCPNETNKWNCAFLKQHNCTIIPQCNPNENNQYYESAVLGAVKYPSMDVAVEKWRRPSDPLPNVMISYQNLIPAMLHDTSSFVVKTREYNLMHDAFYVMVQMRQNFDYRARVSEFMKEFRESSNLDLNTPCIGFHIRRGDRVIAGKNMIEHCKWIEEECKDVPSNEVQNCRQSKNNHDYYGLGCHTAFPYGALSFQHFIDAAHHLKTSGAVNKTLQTIIIMTNDYEWAKNNTLKYLNDWKFHILPQPPHFRGSSIYHGVNNQGSIDTIQQCSALVGHFGSAFTQLIFSYMCFRHGPKNATHFSNCPAAFDFGEAGRSGRQRTLFRVRRKARI